MAKSCTSFHSCSCGDAATYNGPIELLSQNSVNSYLSCYCGYPSPMKMAWTDENPGRRFFGCCNYKVCNCGYFHWVDEKMSPKERLYDFYKKMKDVKVENERMKKTIQKLEKKNKEMENICVNVDNEIDEYVNELVEWKKKCARLEKQSVMTKWTSGLVIVAMLLLCFSVMYY